MSQKSCFFIGHRETPEEIYPVLCAAVEEHGFSSDKVGSLLKNCPNIAA